jgi:hypothetical protein
MEMSGARRRWSVRHLLAAISVAVLALAVMPGCAWLFGMPPGPDHDPGGGPRGATVADPKAPPEMRSQAVPFFESGDPNYRGLGGAMINDGRLVLMKAPPRENVTDHDIALGLAFGRAVLAHYADALSSMSEAECDGDGARKESAIRVAPSGSAEDEIRTGLACVRLRNPGAAWVGASLLVSDSSRITPRAVSHVALMRPDRSTVGFYVDVSRFVAETGSELP